MQQPRIAFDIDGVLFPWTTCSAQAVNTRGYRLSEDPDAHLHWNWLPEQVDPEDWIWLWKGAGLKLMFDRPEVVYPGVERMLHRISEIATIDLVTHRPRAAAPYTAKWVGKRGFPFETLSVLGHTPKSAVIQRANIFIDDKTENCLEALENASCLVGAPRRPWNADLEAKVREQEGDTPMWLGYYDDPMEVLTWVQRSVAVSGSPA